MKNLVLVCVFPLLFTLNTAFADQEIAEEIQYVSNDGINTKNIIVCKNSVEVYIYENNTTKEIRLEKNGQVKELGRVTIDEVIDKVCR